LQSFGIIAGYSNPENLHRLMTSADAMLTLLDRRPGMERWVASLQASPLVISNGRDCSVRASLWQQESGRDVPDKSWKADQRDEEQQLGKCQVE
jgi:hypothetical protein